MGDIAQLVNSIERCLYQWVVQRVVVSDDTCHYNVRPEVFGFWFE